MVCPRKKKQCTAALYHCVYIVICLWIAPIGKAVHGLLAVQALRPDRLTSMARIFVEKVLGANFAHAADKELNLAEIMETEVDKRINLKIMLSCLEHVNQISKYLVFVSWSIFNTYINRYCMILSQSKLFWGEYEGRSILLSIKKKSVFSQASRPQFKQACLFCHFTCQCSQYIFKPCLRVSMVQIM